ncbi:MAG TPA: hypothetical protein VL738_10825 [Dactylosporangium sp.]|jgi:hypothetical protein|nr:hypothetical protein [Dactylosporangium sp.]
MTGSLKRIALAAAAVLGLAAATALAPGAAVAALPEKIPPRITMGGLHLTPSSGTGSDVPSFKADHPCREGTRLANVNTIDLLNVEQTISNNVLGDATQDKGFGTKFNADMNTVQAAAGTPGTAEKFLLMLDCRTGAGHGVYTDAVIVAFEADGAWRVESSPPADGAASEDDSSVGMYVLVGVTVALIGAGVGLFFVLGRRRTKSTA